MAAALLRLLLRRRAATLAPLIPASASAYSKPAYPVRAVAAAGGLPDVRCAHLGASRMPSSMLRLYASEGCVRPAPRQPAHHQATRRLHNHKVSAAATSVLPGSRRMQLSLLLVPTPTRHFSSTGTKDSQFFKKVVNDLREPLTIATLEKANRFLEEGFYDKAFSIFDQGANDLLKTVAIFEKGLDDLVEAVESWDELMDEAIVTLEKADHLLEEGLYDKFFSMIDQGTDKLLKALAIYEKGLDDLVKVVGSCDQLTLATQEHLRVLCKELGGKIKIIRQSVKKLSAGFKNRIALRKGAKGYLPRMGSQGLKDV